MNIEFGMKERKHYPTLKRRSKVSVCRLKVRMNVYPECMNGWVNKGGHTITLYDLQISSCKYGVVPPYDSTNNIENIKS